MRIPITIAAKNEERAIGGCLDSVLESMRVAADRGVADLDLLVVLDDCTDRTEAIVRARGVRTLATSGGKVEAQRAGLRPGPFAIFLDADVLLTPPTIGSLVRTMVDNPDVMVAFPRKLPLLPHRADPLARALHVYNREHGFSSQRSWFNGKCFAMRDWHVPTRTELADRIAALPEDRFYDFSAGMRIDDIYLSRWVVATHGVGALREAPDALLYFRAPETPLGMYRYYRRMRMEIERVSALYPELEPTHRAAGTRRPDRLANADSEGHRAHAIFTTALFACRAAYRLERAYFQHVATTPCSPWPPIEETKCSLAGAILE